MHKDTAKRTALVTGASRGIGRGIAYALAAAGYDLAITYASSQPEAEEVAATIIKDYKKQCLVLQGDLSDAAVPEATVQSAIKGLGHLDVLVNNAGVTMIDSILDLPMEKLDHLINLDFKAYLLAAQAAARHMVEQRIPGNIVNITSSRGQRAYPGDSVYGGLKAALARATESIALDLAPYGIRVNCVAPGATRVRDTEGAAAFYDYLTPRIPLGRVGTPQDIGNAVVWLVSDQASYVTGTTIRVDGGLILPGMPERPGRDTDLGWGFIPKKQ